jgi:hypothetical protein
MDRTVIPNGKQAEQPDARQHFHDFCQYPEVKLVYVTGRHQALVQQAIADYQLPEPDYLITDVGTRIYQANGEQWQPFASWEKEIDTDWHGKSHADIKAMLSSFTELHLQEASKQNTHKLSYYLPLDIDVETLLANIQSRLDQHNVNTSLVWSIDELNQVGLLDVLPRNATKLHAIEFLQQQLGYHRDQVIFAGDSGNDLPVLCSAIRSVLVANASDEVKLLAQQLAEQNGHSDALYLAQAGTSGLDGNYSAGVLQGVRHFAPDFHDILR